MKRNIIKSGEKKNYKSYDFEVFSTVEKGVFDFPFKEFPNSSTEIENNHAVNDSKSKDDKNKNKNQTKTANSSDSSEKETVSLDEHKKILQDELNKAKKKSYDEGFQKGKAEAEKNSKKVYEASEKEYWDTLKKNMDEVRKEIDSIKDFTESVDKELPNLVLNFVKSVIGEERKINDELVISLIKNNLSKLEGLQDIVFYVNPEDLESVKKHFSDFDIESEKDVKKGSFKVKTKIGEIDFDIDLLISDLKKEIDEQFRTDQKD